MIDKIDKYIQKFAKKYGESKSGRSRYYEIGDKILRVSDHIGKTSDGVYQIIVKKNGYLIYHPSSGIINICSYREVQEFVRVFKLFPVNTFEPAMKLFIASDDSNTVLGIPLSVMSDGQKKSIMDITKKVMAQKL